MKKTVAATSMESGVSRSKKMTTEDWRKTNELEKQRKLGKAPFGKAEDDRDINPQISSIPRYIDPSMRPAIKQQRPQEECQKELTDSGKGQKRGVCQHVGEEHLAAPPAELLLGQTEHYVEYSRQGAIIKRQEKAIAHSKYQKDVLINNHTSLWGSYWKDFKWGYKCCHSFDKNSYCLGEAGKKADCLPSGSLVKDSRFIRFIGPMPKPPAASETLSVTLSQTHLDKLNEDKRKPKRRKKSTDSFSKDEERANGKKLKKVHLKKLKADARKEKRKLKKLKKQEKKEKREREKKLKKAIKRNEKILQNITKKAKKDEMVRQRKLQELKRLFRLKRAHERMHLWQDPTKKGIEGFGLKQRCLNGPGVMIPRQQILATNN